MATSGPPNSNRSDWRWAAGIGVALLIVTSGFWLLGGRPLAESWLTAMQVFDKISVLALAMAAGVFGTIAVWSASRPGSVPKRVGLMLLGLVALTWTVLATLALVQWMLGQGG